jgi:hypothetical protein
LVRKLPSKYLPKTHVLQASRQGRHLETGAECARDLAPILINNGSLIIEQNLRCLYVGNSHETDESAKAEKRVKEDLPSCLLYASSAPALRVKAVSTPHHRLLSPQSYYSYSFSLLTSHSTPHSSLLTPWPAGTLHRVLSNPQTCKQPDTTTGERRSHIRPEAQAYRCKAESLGKQINDCFRGVTHHLLSLARNILWTSRSIPLNSSIFDASHETDEIPPDLTEFPPGTSL